MISKDLKFTDFIKEIEGNLGKTEWITILDIPELRTGADRLTYYSALIANSKVEDILKKYEWDLRLGDGQPGFITYYEDGKPINKYCRFSDEGIEPLVYWRTFSGGKESYVEVSEEFRLYFNLYEKNLGNGKKVLIYTDDDGDEDDVVLIDKDKVSVKLKYIKEYLAAKQMHLAIYFEAMRFSDKTLEELDLPETREVKEGNKYIYSISDANMGFFFNDSKSQGLLLGKKIIAGSTDFSPPSWETKRSEQFTEFIVGVDENGKEITCSCNTDNQATNVFLTPVFFKREVLKKYYDSPERYSVEDGNVERKGFWGLRVLNNHREHVVVWLGDLKHLPHKEQTHWRAFNITPSSRKISHADFTRNIEGNFADPEHPELYFKYRFEIFQEAWHKKFGWHLFKPLSSGDAHHLKSLHIPTTNEQKEFDDQIASITKIIIDSLNEEELEKDVTINKENPRGIDKLEAFLWAYRLSIPEMIEFLRNLQALRSTGVAHRKGKNYEKIKEFFKIGNEELPNVFEDILIKCIWTLNALESHFISKKSK